MLLVHRTKTPGTCHRPQRPVAVARRRNEMLRQTAPAAVALLHMPAVMLSGFVGVSDYAQRTITRWAVASTGFKPVGVG